jgi:hypothetical protein
MRSAFILASMLTLLLAAIAGAHPGDTLWTRTYGGGADDLAADIQQTSDGGYIMVGHTKSFGAGLYDVYLVKTDANGDTLWTRSYGGTHYDYSSSVRQTADGGYIILGSTWSFGAGDCDFYLLRTDANGDTLWTRTYGGFGEDHGDCIQLTSDGGYIATGYTESFGAGSFDVWLLKFDANGNTLWTRTYGESSLDMGHFVEQTSDGGYVIAGVFSSYDARCWDAYLIKADAHGDTLWTRAYGDRTYQYARCVRETADGGYIMGGASISLGTGRYNVYLVRTDPNGDSLWTRVYGGREDDQIYCLREIPEGGFMCTGPSKSFGAGEEDVYLLRIDPWGDTLWTRTYGGGGSDYGSSIQRISDGSYIVAGWTMSFGAGARDVWLLKLVDEAQPDVSIDIVPDDPPVTVPQGGTFGYTGTVTNSTEDPQTTDIWIMAAGPLEGVYGPLKEFYDLPLNPGQSRSAHFNQRVRNLAPVGFYNYIAYCGDYPSVVVDSSYFEIEVVSGPTAGSGGWVLTGSFLEGDVADLPSEFALSGNYPNPFNAGTVISYQIPFDAHVKVEVYNISGQKIATVVDNQQEGGYRSVTWDAPEVSSGVYFYKLTAGDFSEIKTMTLLR